MKLILSLILCVVIYPNLAYSQVSKVSLEFVKNGRQIDLQNDEIDIFLVVIKEEQKIIFKPILTGVVFTMPDLCGNNQGHIILRHDGDVYGFGYNYLDFDQNMKWVMGVDKKPYDKEYFLKDIQDKKVDGIAYIEFHPLEVGEGVVTTISITDFKSYMFEGEQLID